MPMLPKIHRGVIGSLILVLSILPFQLIGQFSGGRSDGFDCAGTVQSGLYGQMVNVNLLYQGGSGDGHGTDFYQGVMDGTLVAGLFTGGAGDGFHKNLGQSTVDGINLSVLFLGSEGDGHDTDFYQGVMDGTQVAGLFTGGPGDGFHKVAVQSVLDGTGLDQLFTGGQSDGHDKKGFYGVVNGTSFATLYSGGMGDGFSKRSQQYVFAFPGCTFVVNTMDNGFGSLRYAVDCAQPGDTIIFSPVLLNKTIGLASAPVSIGKNLSLLENEDLNIVIDASVIERAFFIQTGAEVLIQGLKIIVGAASEGSGLQNEGLLTLVDLQLLNVSPAQSALENRGTGTITIEGMVRVLH